MATIPVFFVNKDKHLAMEWMEADACDHVLQVSDNDLLITLPDKEKKVPVRTAFHAGKQYESCYGPYKDLLTVDLAIVEKDPRIHSEREISGYYFGESIFSSKPVLYYYTWLFLKALEENPVTEKIILEHSAFSDNESAEKNAEISPAFAAAVFLLLNRRQELQQAKKELEVLKKVVQVEYEKCFVDPVMDKIPTKSAGKEAKFPSAFQKGNIIEHPEFGRGEIVAIKPYNTFAHLFVVFEKNGSMKQLSESWVRLNCRY